MADLDARISILIEAALGPGDEWGRVHTDLVLDDICNALAATGRAHWHGTCGDCKFGLLLFMYDDGVAELSCSQLGRPVDSDDHCKLWTERPDAEGEEGAV